LGKTFFTPDEISYFIFILR